MANHLSFDVLSRLIERRSPPAEAARAQRHLASCGRCRSELAWLERIHSMRWRAGMSREDFEMRPDPESPSGSGLDDDSDEFPAGSPAFVGYWLPRTRLAQHGRGSSTRFGPDAWGRL